MSDINDEVNLVDNAKQVLQDNRHGKHTIPAEGIYPHQWFWDSCFIAIGLANYDIDRAQAELLSLIKGQWHNGMIPHMVFDPGAFYRQDRELWRSKISPFSSDDRATSGITQPPILAEAVIRIGKKLPKHERLIWYKKMYKPLVRHHSWLYRDRDPKKTGLVFNVHPWETGMDDTPPWMFAINKIQLPIWIKLIEILKLDKLIEKLRRDTKTVPTTQRESTIDGLALLSVMQRIRRREYSSRKILKSKLLAIEDVGFNSILIRNNHHLEHIAKIIDEKLPEHLQESFNKANHALSHLWHDKGQSYFSRNFYNQENIELESIASLLPLYSGAISQQQADILVKKIQNDIKFGAKYPVPSMSKDSGHFNPNRFWQGPSWVNTNWFLIDGLDRYGHKKQAEDLRNSTIAMVKNKGFYEYFSPDTGKGEGAKNFSWTAALVISLIKN